MYIVIAGGGLVGRGLTKRLVEKRHDVVVIDIDQEICSMVYQEFGAVSVHGDATDINVLEDAGIEKADVAVALMRRDPDNLAFCLLADNFGVGRTMTRMRNTRYRDAYKAAGVDKILNIVELYLDQFALEIEQPQLQRVATLGGGKASIVIIAIPDNSKAAGKTVAEITQDKAFPAECVVAGIYRESEERFIIPRGDRQIMAEDRVFLAAATEDLRRAADYLGIQKTRWFSRA